MTMIKVFPDSEPSMDVCVDAYELMVHISVPQDGDLSLTPDDARALAAVLVAQAEAADR